MTDPAKPSRRAIAAAAVSGLSLPVLAACGGGGSSSSTADQRPSAPSTGATNGSNDGGQSPDALIAAAEVPVGGGVVLASQDVVVTQPKRGSFEGFSATCTHQGCMLAGVASGTINCGCHGSQYSISDGSNVAGPSGSPAGSVPALPKVPVRVKRGSVVRA